MTTPSLVVIGNGIAGIRVVEALLTAGRDPYQITVFGAEPHGNYNRILLSSVLAGDKSFDDIVLNPVPWYAENNITVHLNDPVVTIDRAKKQVVSQSGKRCRYDKLLIATGSKPFIIPVPGCDLDGVITFRDMADIDTMVHAAARTTTADDLPPKAVVIGGGLLGLEAAIGLTKRGMDVTVVHLASALMNRQLDSPAALLLQQALEKQGLKFVLSAHTEAIVGRQNQVVGLRLEDGLELAADMVVMAVGIVPNIALAQNSGLYCERGIMVNDTMQSYDPSIYAVGECVQHRNRCYGLVAPLLEQATVCANHLASHGVGHYAGSTVSTTLKVSGIDLFSAGDFQDEAGQSVVYRDAPQGIYKKLIINNNRLLGVVLYGDVADGAWYVSLIQNHTNIAAVRDRLIFGKAYAASLLASQSMTEPAPVRQVA